MFFSYSDFGSFTKTMVDRGPLLLWAFQCGCEPVLICQPCWGLMGWMVSVGIRQFDRSVGMNSTLRFDLDQNWRALIHRLVLCKSTIVFQGVYEVLKYPSVVKVFAQNGKNVPREVSIIRRSAFHLHKTGEYTFSKQTVFLCCTNGVKCWNHSFPGVEGVVIKSQTTRKQVCAAPNALSRYWAEQMASKDSRIPSGWSSRLAEPLHTSMYPLLSEGHLIGPRRL